jgi:hypothetical protein
MTRQETTSSKIARGMIVLSILPIPGRIHSEISLKCSSPRCERARSRTLGEAPGDGFGECPLPLSNVSTIRRDEVADPPQRMRVLCTRCVERNRRMEDKVTVLEHDGHARCERPRRSHAPHRPVLEQPIQMPTQGANDLYRVRRARTHFLASISR